MKKMGEKGLTLVEVLAYLVITSIILILILTTFVNINKFTKNELKLTKLQQEANYITSFILQKHRTVEDCYRLDINDDGHLLMAECDKNEVIIGDKYIYSINTSTPTERIYPKSEDLEITLKVIDKENTNLSVSVDTVFKRYKTNN